MFNGRNKTDNLIKLPEWWFWFRCCCVIFWRVLLYTFHLNEPKQMVIQKAKCYTIINYRTIKITAKVKKMILSSFIFSSNNFYRSVFVGTVLWHQRLVVIQSLHYVALRCMSNWPQKSPPKCLLWKYKILYVAITWSDNLVVES